MREIYYTGKRHCRLLGLSCSGEWLPGDWKPVSEEAAPSLLILLSVGSVSMEFEERAWGGRLS